MFHLLVLFPLLIWKCKCKHYSLGETMWLWTWRQTGLVGIVFLPLTCAALPKSHDIFNLDYFIGLSGQPCTNICWIPNMNQEMGEFWRATQIIPMFVESGIKQLNIKHLVYCLIVVVMMVWWLHFMRALAHFNSFLHTFPGTSLKILCGLYI